MGRRTAKVYHNAYKKIMKCLSVALLVLLLFSLFSVTYADEEKTPALVDAWVNGREVNWYPAKVKSGLKFRFYYKDKWSGESFQLVARCKGFDSHNMTGRRTSIYFRDATNEKDPQIIKENKNGITYYSLPAISGHKYKIAVKAYDEEYGLWSDKETAEYYFMSTPEIKIKQTKKGFSLSWEPVIGATKYYIYRDDDTSRIWEEQCAKLVGNDMTKYNDTDVINGHTYTYYVVAGRGKWRVATESDLLRAELS